MIYLWGGISLRFWLVADTFLGVVEEGVILQVKVISMTVEKRDGAILEWIDKYKLRNSRGDLFEFDKHAFLLDPISDWSHQIAVRKSAQIGFSESFGILKALFGAFYYKWAIIYTNPTNTSSERFVREKVDPIIEANSVLQDMVGFSKLDSKLIGNRFIHFRGTHSPESQDKKAESDRAISTTSDLNIFDERDRSDQYVIDQYYSRMENSDYGGAWSFSNPSYPGVGADGLWEESDQKHWMVTCEHCGHKQYLDWVKLGEETGVVDHCYIDSRRQLILCGKCQGIIGDDVRVHGEWVARYPGRDISGYWMSQLNYIQHKVASIGGKRGLLEKEEKLTKQTFYNFVLGKPYRGTDMSVDRSIIIQNKLRTENDKKDVFMGVDCGVINHYVIGNMTGIFEIGETKDWGKIEQLIRKYDAIAVIDARPDKTKVKKLVDKYRGDGGNRRPRVYMCYYVADKADVQLIKWGKKKNRGNVYVQREAVFDMLVDAYTNILRPINLHEQALNEFIAHWNSMSRVDFEDNMGVIKPKWVSSNKKDHYAHADLYQWVAMSRGLTNTDSNVSSFTSANTVTNQRISVKIDEQWTSALPSLSDILKGSDTKIPSEW